MCIALLDGSTQNAESDVHYGGVEIFTLRAYNANQDCDDLHTSRKNLD